MRKVNKPIKVRKPALADRTRSRGKLPVQSMSSYNDLVSAIECLVQDARTGIKAAMNAIMLQTYWRTGEYIVEYEQNGADRAVYGDGLMRRLARDLTLRLGRGFAHSNLNYMRKFYLMSQKIQTSGFSEKGQTFGFLTWSHYLEILRADDPLEIASTSCIFRTRINCAASWRYCLMMRQEARSMWRKETEKDFGGCHATKRIQTV